VDLNQMVVFVRVVQAGGFSAAARQLRMPKSTVSRKVSELEQRMGARLIQRTTRKLGLTDAGRIYYDRAAQIVSDVQDAEQAVGRVQATPRGLLRVTAPLGFGALAAVVAEVLARHPEVQVELVCTDRRLDLVEERLDVAIRAGPLADSALIARKIATLKGVLVAAPGYCKKHGVPRTPADLPKHACIAFGVGATPNVWILESAGKRSQVRFTPRLTVNDVEFVRAAALAGAGIAPLSELGSGEDLRRGRLRRVLPDWSTSDVPIHALYPSTRHLSPKVTAFLDLVAERFRNATLNLRLP
jgi:DNA-binding transcriptional LysR family regulator